jgi:hypothetical protein
MIDLPVSEATQNGDDSARGAMWPLLGPGAKSMSFKFAVEGVADIDYLLKPGGPAADAPAEIEANWYEYEARSCRLVQDQGAGFVAVPGSACTKQGGYKINAWFEQLNYERTLMVDLPKAPFWKIYSRMAEYSEYGDPIGQIVIAADPTAVSAILADARKIAVSIKFGRKYALAGEDGCYTTLTLKFATTVKAERSGVTIDLKRLEDFKPRFCEIQRI